MNPQEFNKLSQNDILNKFNYWKKLQTSFTSIDDLKVAIYSLISGCRFNSADITDLSFFRAQKNNGSILFQNESRLWNPPKDLVKEMGRANRIGQSMMYLGLDGRTALFELSPQKFDYLTMATFEIKEKQSLNLLYFSVDNFFNHPTFIKLKAMENKRLKALKVTKNGRNNIKLVHHLLSEEYSTPILGNNADYLLTIAISEVIFDLTSGFLDGLIYRSIKSPNDFNYVLRPESAQRVLRMKKCDFFQVLDFNSENSYTIKRIKTTEKINSVNDELIWTDKLSEKLDWYSFGTPSLIKMQDYKM